MTTITNSTLTRNVSGGGGGIYHAAGTLRLRQSTVSGNSAPSGGGLRTELHAEDFPPNLEIENSIIAANIAWISPDISKTFLGSITGTGINLIGDNHSVAADFPAGTFVGTTASPIAPRLAPAGDFGGPTQTMPPLFGSPVIDAAPATSATTDQRGSPRQFGPAPDIGAVEFQGESDIALTFPVVWGIDFDGDGIPYGQEFAVGSDPFRANLGSLLQPTFVDPPHAGGIAIQFGQNVAASPYAAWVLKRSTDMVHYTEIYRLENDIETITGIITAVRSGGSIKVIDPAPPLQRAFYQLEVLLLP